MAERLAFLDVMKAQVQLVLVLGAGTVLVSLAYVTMPRINRYPTPSPNGSPEWLVGQYLEQGVLDSARALHLNADASFALHSWDVDRNRTFESGTWCLVGEMVELRSSDRVKLFVRQPASTFLLQGPDGLFARAEDERYQLSGYGR